MGAEMAHLSCNYSHQWKLVELKNAMQRILIYNIVLSEREYQIVTTLHWKLWRIHIPKKKLSLNEKERLKCIMSVVTWNFANMVVVNCVSHRDQLSVRELSWQQVQKSSDSTTFASITVGSTRIATLFMLTRWVVFDFVVVPYICSMCRWLASDDTRLNVRNLKFL